MNKTVLEAVKIKLALSDKLVLGNLHSKRDWGHAKDYVEAMWLMMQQSNPSDFVIATGETRTVQEMLEYVFYRLNLDWTRFVLIYLNEYEKGN